MHGVHVVMLSCITYVTLVLNVRKTKTYVVVAVQIVILSLYITVRPFGEGEDAGQPDTSFTLESLHDFLGAGRCAPRGCRGAVAVAHVLCCILHVQSADDVTRGPARAQSQR